MDLQSLKSNPGDAQNYLSCATNERKINQQVKSQPTSRTNHTVQGYTLCTTSKGNPEKKYIRQQENYNGDLQGYLPKISAKHQQLRPYHLYYLSPTLLTTINLIKATTRECSPPMLN